MKKALKCIIVKKEREQGQTEETMKKEKGTAAGYIRGKTVLVTGGGGSVGSELCRQIAGCSPERLIIFDIYENCAYELQQELLAEYEGICLDVLIGSVRDKARIDGVFSEYRPDIVFHAAAHKHVPLMETSPHEAVKNNVFGTVNTASAADKYGAEAFILISTDKAVNPTSVMGATKRVCEMVIRDLGAVSSGRFACVRFGNVAESRGSVIPLFRQQIDKGGPVTVTHKEVNRFFMTISDAASLVLEAGAYARDGEIFVLDMGEPVKIDELARNMIRESGLVPDVDIEVRYTGLRPGEKLYEELLLSCEGVERKISDRIFAGKLERIDGGELRRGLSELWRACEDPESDIRAVLTTIVPEYRRT